MTWQTVVNVFAVIGASSVTVTIAVLVVSLVLTRNTDSLNRHSQHE
jgi:hypothetical protein